MTPPTHYKIQIETGPPRGDLYELEQTTYYRVVHTQTQQVVLTFQSDLEAALSRENGQWDNYRVSGVSAVSLEPDGCSVRIQYHDGRETVFPIPN